jgi:hypothetical protein
MKPLTKRFQFSLPVSTDTCILLVKNMPLSVSFRGNFVGGTLEGAKFFNIHFVGERGRADKKGR